MNKARRKWFSLLVDATVGLSRARHDEADIRKEGRRRDFNANIARWPMRMTGFLRNSLRRRWLRLSR